MIDVYIDRRKVWFAEEKKSKTEGRSRKRSAGMPAADLGNITLEDLDIELD